MCLHAQNSWTPEIEQMCWMVCRQMPTQLGTQLGLPTSLSIITYIIYVCSINTIK